LAGLSGVRIHILRVATAGGIKLIRRSAAHTNKVCTPLTLPVKRKDIGAAGAAAVAASRQLDSMWKSPAAPAPLSEQCFPRRLQGIPCPQQLQAERVIKTRRQLAGLLRV
jgi:hypothetical protein